jgi:hypothetical protein
MKTCRVEDKEISVNVNIWSNQIGLEKVKFDMGAGK